MTRKKKINEQRKHKRFRVKQGVYIMKLSDSEQMNPIADISMGGLSYYYIADEDKSEQHFTASIVIPFNKFSIDNVKVSTASDIEISNQTDFGYISMRRCGLQFKELTADQTDSLEDFILHHTERENGVDIPKQS